LDKHYYTSLTLTKSFSASFCDASHASASQPNWFGRKSGFLRPKSLEMDLAKQFVTSREICAPRPSPALKTVQTRVNSEYHTAYIQFITFQNRILPYSVPQIHPATKVHVPSEPQELPREGQYRSRSPAVPPYLRAKRGSDHSPARCAGFYAVGAVAHSLSQCIRQDKTPPVCTASKIRSLGGLCLVRSSVGPGRWRRLTQGDAGYASTG